MRFSQGSGKSYLKPLTTPFCKLPNLVTQTTHRLRERRLNFLALHQKI